MSWFHEGGVRLRAALVLLIGLAACARGEPPTPDVSPSVALPDEAFPAPSPARSGDGSLGAIASQASDAAATDIPEASAQALQQTHDQPSSTPAFEARAKALWNAIVQDRPSLAMPFFFPLGAYEQVKDVADPAGDWRHRLVAAYGRDIHKLHAHLGDDEASARFVSVDVPASRAKWIEPGEEWNKVGYYRVFGSKLRYEVDGERKSFDIKSLISWRGEWYVVHLSAIK